MTTIQIIILPYSQYLIVTGGYRSGNLDSTEIYSFRDNVWSVSGKLPARIWGLRAATINKRVLLFGNYIFRTIL